ncbi:hypothetical protein GS489_31610 [Rhodococcus hoagii]|nr:hypothetical protein [Prescottella equi]
MVGALLGALSDGHWRPLATLGVVCLVSFAVVMLTFTVHVDRSGDLTDADREEIDSAIEHISLSRGDYKEYRLAEYAAALAQRIAHSPAWASNFLESHRIELNYREELRDTSQSTLTDCVRSTSNSGSRPVATPAGGTRP